MFRCASDSPNAWRGLAYRTRGNTSCVIAEKTSAFAMAQEVFPRVLYANPRQAFGESLAHLNMLASLGRLTRDVGADGAIMFAPA